MSKKKRKNKRVPEKRRIPKEPQKTPATMFDVRSDLRKTAVLTVVCLVILFALYLTQSRWSP